MYFSSYSPIKLTLFYFQSLCGLVSIYPSDPFVPQPFSVLLCVSESQPLWPALSCFSCPLVSCQKEPEKDQKEWGLWVGYLLTLLTFSGLSWIEAAVLYQMSQLLLGSTSPMANGGEREQYNKKMYKVSNYYLKYFPWVNKWGIMVYNTLWRLFSIWAMKPSLWK